MRRKQLSASSVLIVAGCLCAACGRGERVEGNPLADQPDRWVNSIPIAEDSNPRYIGKTTELLITASTPEPRALTPRPSRVSVGETYEGVKIGAILCDFMTTNGSFNGEQLLWRGRWSCKAGRDRHEVETSVDDEGHKRYDYIFISPVDLR